MSSYFLIYIYFCILKCYYGYIGGDNLELVNINEKIKFLRKSKGITQKQLADKSGVSEISIRKYESGDRNPKYEQLQKIASALEVSMEVFSYKNNLNVNETENNKLIMDEIYKDRGKAFHAILERHKDLKALSHEELAHYFKCILYTLNREDLLSLDDESIISLLYNIEFQTLLDLFYFKYKSQEGE